MTTPTPQDPAASRHAPELPDWVDRLGQVWGQQGDQQDPQFRGQTYFTLRDEQGAVAPT